MPKPPAVAIACLLAAIASVAHAAPEQITETEPLSEETPDRRAVSAAVLGGIYAGFTTWAYFAWYHDVEQLPDLEVGHDGYFGAETYAGGADKLGHFTANYALTRASTRLLRWGGWKPLPASVVAGGMSALYFAFIEIKDGYYYELSPGDLVANTLGAAAAIAMENSPTVDRFLDFRIEYWPSPAYRAIVRGDDTGEINTLNIAEDYTGQKYMLALHLGAFEPVAARPETAWMRYVDVVAGFHAENYKPHAAPDDEIERRQSLYLGVSLNGQAVWDRFFDGTTGAAGHHTLEIVNVPFTSLPVIEASRSPDAGDAM